MNNLSEEGIGLVELPDVDVELYDQIEIFAYTTKDFRYAEGEFNKPYLKGLTDSVANIVKHKFIDKDLKHLCTSIKMVRNKETGNFRFIINKIMIRQGAVNIGEVEEEKEIEIEKELKDDIFNYKKSGFNFPNKILVLKDMYLTHKGEFTSENLYGEYGELAALNKDYKLSKIDNDDIRAEYTTGDSSYIFTKKDYITLLVEDAIDIIE